MREAIGLEHSSFAQRNSPIDTDKQSKIAEHARAIAAILYEETERTAHVGQLNCPTVSSPEKVKTLVGMHSAVRGHLLEHVNREIASFLSKQVRTRGANRIRPRELSVAVPKLDESDASTASWES